MLLMLMLMLPAAANTNVAMPRLTPMPVDAKERTVSLDGKWMFNPRPEKNFQRSTLTNGWNAMRVPCDWRSRGYDIAEGTETGFRRNFFVPERWTGDRVKLRCDGIAGDCTIYVNGRLAGRHSGGFTAFEYDVTRFVNFGVINEMAIGVRAGGTAMHAALPDASDMPGGIIRSIYLLAVPPVNMSMLHVDTAVEQGSAAVNAIVELANESKQPVGKLYVDVTVTDPDGKEAGHLSARYSDALKPDATALMFPRLVLDKPRLWSPESPALYTLTCRLVDDGGRELATAQRRFGVRSIGVDGDALTLNGRPFTLHGAERDIYPLHRTADTCRMELDRLLDANVNMLRAALVPPDEHLLDAADEAGVLVEVAFPLANVANTVVADTLRRRVFADQPAAVLSLLRSHPSVIAWRTPETAGRYGELLDEVRATTARLDPGRPAVAPRLLASATHTGPAIADSLGRPTPEYWNMKKQNSPVRLTLAENVRADGRVTLNADNRYSFTDLSDCTIAWKAGDCKGTVKADVAPGETGTIVITLPEAARRAETMEVSVTDSYGRLTDLYSFRLRPVSERVTYDDKNRQPLTFLERADSYLATDGTVTVSVSKLNGLLNVNRGAKAVLSGPRLMVDGAPAGGWVARSVTARPAKESVTIEVEGDYDGACGTYIYTIGADGQLDIAYDFRLTDGRESSEAGIRLGLDRSFDTLDWSRRARWNAYPAWNPEAAEGSAKAVYTLDPRKGETELPPACEPADEGCAMFSTRKDNIYKATLRSGDGATVTVSSNGRQDFRARRAQGMTQAEVTARTLRPSETIGGSVNLTLK